MAKNRPKKKGTAKKTAATQTGPKSATPGSPVNHRITVEAQKGRDTLASERWLHTHRPPTVAEVLNMLDQLEAKLSDREREARREAFAQARAFVTEVAASNYTAPPPLQASFPKPALKGGVRVDVNIFEGRIVP